MLKLSVFVYLCYPNRKGYLKTTVIKEKVGEVIQPVIIEKKREVFLYLIPYFNILVQEHSVCNHSVSANINNLLSNLNEFVCNFHKLIDCNAGKYFL